MHKVDLEPRFVPLRGAKVSDEELLLVHRSSGFKTLLELQGKKLLLLNDARGSLGRNWLESLVMAEGFSVLEAFFGEIRNTSKYSRTVLPVFFRQADACLVPRSGFSTMTELNPQLGKDLDLLAFSPAVVPSVLCVRPDYEPDLKQALIEGLGTLHEEPRGQQILVMFKVDRLVPFQTAFLESAQQLLRKHAAHKEAVEGHNLKGAK
jgi:phosphonate transport system substrate-binding protein